MAGQVRLTVDADLAKAYSAFAKLIDQTSKAEKGLEKMAAAGDRAERSQSKATEKLVSRIQKQTGSADLALSQSERSALRAGFTPSGGGGALANSIERRMVAQQLREERQFQQFVREESAVRQGRAAGSMFMMDSALGRGSAALAASAASRSVAEEARRKAVDTRTFNAASASSWGAYGRVPGESGIEARARADVGRSVAGMSELNGKVSPDDLQQMTTRRADQLTDELGTRKRFATGALAVGAAVAGVVNAAEQQLAKYSETLVRSEDELATLYGVDKNPASRARLRAGAIGTSIGSGIDLAQIGQLQGRLASTFGDLPADVNQEAVQAALRLAKIGGKDVTSSALGLGAGYMAYGKKLGGGANAMKLMTNRLVRGADIGGFDIDKVTGQLAALYNAGSLAGYSDSEVTGAMTLVSKSGMDVDTWATGLRNNFLMMMKAEAKGKFKRTGSLMGDVAAEGQLSGGALTQLVGKENVGVAVMMKENQDLLRQYIDELSKMTATMDVLGQKISASYSDKMFGTVETIKSAQEVQKNAPLIQAESPMIQEKVSDWEIRKAGAEVGTAPMMSYFKKPSVWMETALSGMADFVSPGGASKGENFDLGLAHMIAGAEQAGDESKASYLRLKYGSSTKRYYDTAQGQHYTTEEDAEALMKLRAEGYPLNDQGYLKLRGLQSTNPTEADLYLEEKKAGRSFGNFGGRGEVPEPSLGLWGGVSASRSLTGAAKGIAPITMAGTDKALSALAAITPALLEASKNHIEAATIMRRGATDTGTHVE